MSNNALSLLTALSMTVGRAPAARVIANIAQLSDGDNLVDVGCGPGTAVRIAAQRVNKAVGVDPDPITLSFARWITRWRHVSNVEWLKGSAESIPVDSESATVAWSLSSVHHWVDRDAGIREIHRILKPGGRIVLSERLVKERAKGHAAHGVTRAGLDDLADAVRQSGFESVTTDIQSAGRRTLCIVLGRRSG